MSIPLDLIDHLNRTLGIDTRTAGRLVEEVLAYYQESAEAYVRRRHAELQAEGERNARIFRRIRGELREGRFCAPPLSERQIRRLIYG